MTRVVHRGEEILFAELQGGGDTSDEVSDAAFELSNDDITELKDGIVDEYTVETLWHEGVAKIAEKLIMLSEARENRKD